MPSGSMIMAGRIRTMSGFRVGMQAQVMPTLTSIEDHISDREAFHANSAWSPKVASGLLELVGDTLVMACWR